MTLSALLIFNGYDIFCCDTLTFEEHLGIPDANPHSASKIGFGIDDLASPSHLAVTAQAGKIHRKHTTAIESLISYCLKNPELHLLIAEPLFHDAFLYIKRAYSLFEQEIEQQARELQRGDRQALTLRHTPFDTYLERHSEILYRNFLEEHEYDLPGYGGPHLIGLMRCFSILDRSIMDPFGSNRYGANQMIIGLYSFGSRQKMTHLEIGAIRQGDVVRPNISSTTRWIAIGSGEEFVHEFLDENYSPDMRFETGIELVREMFNELYVKSGSGVTGPFRGYQVLVVDRKNQEIRYFSDPEALNIDMLRPKPIVTDVNYLLQL